MNIRFRTAAAGFLAAPFLLAACDTAPSQVEEDLANDPIPLLSLSTPPEGVWKVQESSALCDPQAALGCLLIAALATTHVLDLFNAAETHQVHPFGGYYGSINLTPPAGSVPDALEHVFSYGSIGGALAPLQADGTFGLTGLGPLNDNTTDAMPNDGRSDSGGALYVNHSRNEVGAIDYLPDGALVGSTAIASAALNGFSGAAVSAVGRTPGGTPGERVAVGLDVLVAMDGAPGELVRGTVGSTSVQSVATLGNGPRRLRFSGDLAAVSNFDSDDLTVLQWTPGGAVQVVATVPVGDGPVGIDLIPVSGGRTAVISTGFNDDTYTLTVLDPAGAVVSNTTAPVAPECRSPGHAVLVDSGSEIWAVISCNGSNNLQRVAVTP